MLVDTDVLIWNLRGNAYAADMLDGADGFTISAVTYMELVQGVRNKSELLALRRAIRFWGAKIQSIDTDISARAMYLVESYSLSHGMQMADALIASTALSIGIPLLTANDKHYRHVDDLEIMIFRPEGRSTDLQPCIYLTS
ncbi:type II toxin-antitoxin system VapC family toxin [Sedimenticola hydrogenitrophicus]|uniref:type II toxin-antitoxin system VapC family toxin n=1 Tax=Sedimenticola hydrogenitrophicus TaxID=2967975 RepID=UPI0023B112D0|nr:type II toxin-antitoxin system VapC family toxin [Sedimenticola hydrogenitrophicus]